MLPKWHALFGFILAVVLIAFFNVTPVNACLVFLSSSLIDFDHYLYYVYRKRNFNLRKAYFSIKKLGKACSKLPLKERKGIFVGYFIFHGLEVVVLLIVMGFLVTPYFYYISLGIFLHLIMDIFYEKRAYGRWDKVSLIYDIIKFRKLKNIF